MKNLILIAASFCMMSSGLAIADSLPIEPGLWEFKTTESNPMTGEEETEIETECVAENEYDPATMMENQEGCVLQDSSLQGDTLTFSISCRLPMGRMTMTAIYRSDGNRVQGTSKVKISFGDRTLTSKGTFTGKRLGACQK